MEFVCCKTNKPMPTIGMQDVKSSQKEQMAEELATRVRKAIDDACPTLIGDYTAR